MGALKALEALWSHRLLDRLIRGRMWIGIVAFALIGIVTLQLGLLRLNSNIGRALEKESALQRSNAALSIENSELAGGDRVESQAGHLGMRLTGVGGLQFHNSHARSDVGLAAAALKAPLKATEANPEHASGGASGAESGAGAQGAGASGGKGGETASETAPSGETAASGETPRSSENAPAGEAASSTGGSSERTSSTPAENEASGAPASAGAEPSAGAGGGTVAPGG